MIRLILTLTCLLYSSSVLCKAPNFLKENDVTRFFCKQNISFTHFSITKSVKNNSIAVSSKLSCGGTSRLKKISLRNPSSIPSECRYTIKPSNLRVCQVTLNVTFHLLLQIHENIFVKKKNSAANRFRYGLSSASFERQRKLPEMLGRCVSRQ